MKKKKQRPQGFGEMKRGAGQPTSAKAGKLTKEAETAYGALVEKAHIYWMQGRTQEVISLLRKAIAVNPKHPAAYYNLGNALLGGGDDLQAAIVYYRKAIAIDPNHPEVYVNLGNALRKQGDLQGAIDAYYQALAIKPTNPELYYILGIVLEEQGDLQSAIGAYHQALATKPNDPEAYAALGNALRKQGDLQGAIDAYYQALAIKPTNPELYYILGIVLEEQGDLQSAIGAYQQTLAIKPNAPEAYAALGHALQEQGDLQGAIDAYHQALVIKPNDPKTNCGLSTVQLLLGDYEHGWEGYEWRLLDISHQILTAHPQVELWDGYNLALGEPLILVGEQGLGDILQFMRYVLYLNHTGRTASLCAPTKLHGLIKASGITTTIYSPEEGNQITQGKWLPLLSLPKYLNVGPANPLVEPPYIKAPEQRVEHWREKLAAETRPIIGINWQGSQTGAKKGRNFPLAAFVPVIEKTDASLLSLQKGDGLRAVGRLPVSPSLCWLSGRDQRDVELCGDRCHGRQLRSRHHLRHRGCPLGGRDEPSPHLAAADGSP